MGPKGWALAGALATAAGPAAAEWEYHFYPAEAGEEMAVCTAGIYYADGPFVLRVYESTVDFYLADDELSLPPDRMLGTVVLAFRDIDFVLEADSGYADHGGPVDHLFLTPGGRDVAPLLERLRSERAVEVVFPDGLGYTIDLTGSSAALREAFECWSREITGPLARHGGRNPFGDGAPAHDPFD